MLGFVGDRVLAPTTLLRHANTPYSLAGGPDVTAYPSEHSADLFVLLRQLVL